VKCKFFWDSLGGRLSLTSGQTIKLLRNVKVAKVISREGRWENSVFNGWKGGGLIIEGWGEKGGFFNPLEWGLQEFSSSTIGFN